MSQQDDGKLRASRRGFLASVAGTALTASAATVAAPRPAPHDDASSAARKRDVEPFFGRHQGGIATPLQSHTYFASFDLVATRREDVIALLQAWTAAAARLSVGQPAQPLDGPFKPVAMQVAAAPAKPKSADSDDGDDYQVPDPSETAGDSGDAIDASPARLTITFGFGPGLFTKDGKDRYGLADKRPAALADLPKFAGDQLVEAHSGGDLSVQACSDDPQVTFHAVRQLARIAGDTVKLRWVQTGFLPDPGGKLTPRNLMGFKDGTVNPSTKDEKAMASLVWAGDEGPAWMAGGSYMVTRRIRIALEHWDRTKVAFQEQTIGREKISGAPLGGKHEFDAKDLKAVDKDGNPVISETSHIRLAAAESNDGAQILRRGYAYNDGVNFTAERWPPWNQGLEYDAGLFFIAYQRDPRTGFVKIFEKMAKLDMLNQFVTHVGGGLFAVPPGAAPGEYIGQKLFTT